MLETNMLKTLWATIRQGKIELLELADLPEGMRVLVTLLPDGELPNHKLSFGAGKPAVARCDLG